VTQFLILIAFGCMVWAGGVTLLYIMACRELDALKREVKESGERAKFYSDYSDRRDAEVERLELENARLAGDLFTIRNWVHKLRVKAGEIAPDGRLLPRHRTPLPEQVTP
jgi:hypothetical protein